MRAVRLVPSAAALVAALAGASACNAAQANAAGVWVEVSPSSITAGYSVAIRASCGDNSNSATVSSPAFGSISVEPLNSQLQAEVSVPQRTAEGSYDVTLTCRTGSSATTRLWVINKAAGRGTLGPRTGGGFLARHDDGSDPSTTGSGKTALLSGVALTLAVGSVGAVSVVRRRRTRADDSTVGR